MDLEVCFELVSLSSDLLAQRNTCSAFSVTCWWNESSLTPHNAYTSGKKSCRRNLMSKIKWTVFGQFFSTCHRHRNIVGFHKRTCGLVWLDKTDTSMYCIWFCSQKTGYETRYALCNTWTSEAHKSRGVAQRNGSGDFVWQALACYNAKRQHLKRMHWMRSDVIQQKTQRADTNSLLLVLQPNVSDLFPKKQHGWRHLFTLTRNSLCKQQNGERSRFIPYCRFSSACCWTGLDSLSSESSKWCQNCVFIRRKRYNAQNIATSESFGPFLGEPSKSAA